LRGGSLGCIVFLRFGNHARHTERDADRHDGQDDESDGAGNGFLLGRNPNFLSVIATYHFGLLFLFTRRAEEPATKRSAQREQRLAIRQDAEAPFGETSAALSRSSQLECHPQDSRRRMQFRFSRVSEWKQVREISGAVYQGGRPQNTCTRPADAFDARSPEDERSGYILCGARSRRRILSARSGLIPFAVIVRTRVAPLRPGGATAEGEPTPFYADSSYIMATNRMKSASRKRPGASSLTAKRSGGSRKSIASKRRRASSSVRKRSASGRGATTTRRSRSASARSR
jgi:hypothetical protein